MRELTRAEEQIMQVLWRLGRGLVKDILAELPEPQPAYNTVSTIVRILEKKGFVSYKAYGKTHEYFPLVSMDEYRRTCLRSLVNRFFGNSPQELVSFFAQDRRLSLEDLETIKVMLGEEIARQKGRRS
ncbi:MAG: BlaI/MecI/CopY family transcriptional regulator [Acidobacteriota bacterium]